MMYSSPRLFLLILFGVFFKGMTFGVIVVVLGLLSWMTTSRLVRASFLSLKHREFVEAARCVGARDRRIIFPHIPPNPPPPIIVAATPRLPGAILPRRTPPFPRSRLPPP